MTTLNKETTEGFDRLLSDGASKDKLEGYLLFNGVAKKDAISYLKERGLIGRQTFRVWLTNKCIEDFLGIEEFKVKIAGESANVIRHTVSYNNERVIYNNIHAKYSEEIKEKVELEIAKIAKETKEGGFKKEKEGDSKAKEKKSFKAPKKPTTIKGLYKSCMSMCHPDKANGHTDWCTEKAKEVNKYKDNMMNLNRLWDEIVAELSK